MVNLNDFKFYLDKAKKYKDEIKSIYTEVLEYTDVLQVIDDSSRTQAPPNRKIDTDITEAISGLQSYVMNSVFSTQSNWAYAKLDENLFRLVNKRSLSTDKRVKEINSNLESDVTDTFTYIQGSGYYNEIAKAVRDFVSLGTGSYKITEQNDLSNPFFYEYIDINNLFICDDIKGHPNFVFKFFYNKNATDLSNTYGKEITLPSNVSEEEKTESVDIIEAVLPIYKGTEIVFNHVVVLSDLETVLLDEELSYNPFVVFRWETVKSSPWGFGLAVKILDTFKELASYKEARAIGVNKYVNPPMNYIGQKELYYRLSNKPGADNYLGDGTSMTPASYTPANLGVQLIPVDQDIADLRNRIRTTFMTMPLGTPEDTKYTSATAVQLRANEFKKRFASTYELINSELLRPTFLAPFMILLKKKLLATAEDDIKMTQIDYMNTLTKSAKSNKNAKYINYAQIANQLIQLNTNGLLFKNDIVIGKIADNLELETEDRWTPEEIEKIQQAQYEAQLREAQAQGQGGQTSGEQVQ